MRSLSLFITNKIVRREDVRRAVEDGRIERENVQTFAQDGKEWKKKNQLQTTVLHIGLSK